MLVEGVDNMILQESISANIKEALTKIGKNQAWLARETGVKPQNISAYIRGISIPDLSTICRIADKLGVSIDWICGRNVEADDSEKEKTLGDIAREIMYMDNMTGVFFSSVTRTERKCISFKGEYPEYEDFDVEYPAIVFSYGNMCSFIKDWQKIKILKNSYTIDEELYQLWVDKHISDLDKLQAIEPPPDFEHMKYDDEVPF